MATWPSDLPGPLARGWSASRQDNKAVVQPEIGPAIVRRRGTAAGYETPATWVFDAVELAVFEAFYLDDLADGSLVFAMQEPRTGTAAVFRFVGAYEIAPPALGSYRVTARLLRLP